MRITHSLSALLLSAIVCLPLHADDEPAQFSGMLAAHNAARSAVGVAALRWSDTLALEAQQWADQLAREDCKLRYDPDPTRRETTGQNLFRAYGSAPYSGTKRTPAEAAERWVREGQQYDHTTHRCRNTLGSQCGAYLQVIWEATTALGCGVARCEAAEVWACHYAPRGGQDGLKPYGNAPQSSPAAEAVLVQQCNALVPTVADRFSEALSDKLPPQ
ncbi:MAG: CAP domain-containing protein [Pseudomonadota bacterium]